MRETSSHTQLSDISRAQLPGKGICVVALEFNTSLGPRSLMEVLSGKLEQHTQTVAVGGLREFCSTFLEQSGLL